MSYDLRKNIKGDNCSLSQCQYPVKCRSETNKTNSNKGQNESDKERNELSKEDNWLDTSRKEFNIAENVLNTREEESKHELFIGLITAMSIIFIVTSPIFCCLKCRRSVTETCDIEGNGVDDAERGLDNQDATATVDGSIINPNLIKFNSMIQENALEAVVDDIEEFAIIEVINVEIELATVDDLTSSDKVEIQ